MDGKLLGNEESISALLQVSVNGVECVYLVWGTRWGAPGIESNSL